MNLPSKRLTLTTIGLLAPVVISLSPFVASASVVTSPFCTNLANRISQINGNLTNLQTKLTNAWNQRDQTIAANNAKWDQDLAADRAKWAAERQTQFSDLQAKATTDAEKAAVQAFITTVTNAINARESANDAARTTYREAVHNLLLNQRSTISGQLTTFVNAVDAAEATATASCQSTPNQGPAIRTTFVNAMKTARQNFVTERKGDSGIGDQVKQLAQTRSNTIKANDTAFQNIFEAAVATLKAAFSSTNI